MSTRDNKEMEIDVYALFRVLWLRKWLIAIIAIIFGLVAFLYSSFVITPSYTSATRIYVVNQASDRDRVTAQDLQAGNYLVQDYQSIITSVDVLSRVIEEGGLNYGVDTLSKKVTVDIPTDTRIVTIKVRDSEPTEAQRIANVIREVATEKIKTVTKVDDVTTLEEANLPTSPSSPNIRRNTALAVVAGGFLAVVIVLLVEIFNDQVRKPEDIEERLDMTLLAVIPDANKK